MSSEEKLHIVPCTRGMYVTIRTGSGVRLGCDHGDANPYMRVEEGELVLLLCTAREVMKTFDHKMLYEVGMAIVSDDVLCLTKHGMYWIQGSNLELT